MLAPKASAAKVAAWVMMALGRAVAVDSATPAAKVARVKAARAKAARARAAPAQVELAKAALARAALAQVEPARALPAKAAPARSSKLDPAARAKAAVTKLAGAVALALRAAETYLPSDRHSKQTGIAGPDRRRLNA